MGDLGMAISKRTRFEIMRRDDYTCRYCRSKENALTIDHVVPVALGGTDHPDNLVAACAACNSGKGSTGPAEAIVADVKDDDARWADALKRAAEIRATKREAFLEYRDTFGELWPLYLPDGWEDTIESLYEAGLPADDLRRAVRAALNARNADSPFRYFCGVAWRMVRELQALAKELLEADESAGVST